VLRESWKLLGRRDQLRSWRTISTLLLNEYFQRGRRVRVVGCALFLNFRLPIQASHCDAQFQFSILLYFLFALTSSHRMLGSTSSAYSVFVCILCFDYTLFLLGVLFDLLMDFLLVSTSAFCLGRNGSNDDTNENEHTRHIYDVWMEHNWRLWIGWC